MLTITCTDRSIQVIPADVSKSHLLTTISSETDGDFPIPFDSHTFTLFLDMSKGTPGWPTACLTNLPELLKLMDFLNIDQQLYEMFDRELYTELGGNNVSSHSDSSDTDSDDEEVEVDIQQVIEPSLDIFSIRDAGYSIHTPLLHRAARSNIIRWIATTNPYAPPLLKKVQDIMQGMNDKDLENFVDDLCRKIKKEARKSEHPYFDEEESVVEAILTVANALDAGDRVFAVFDTYLGHLIGYLNKRRDGWGIDDDLVYQEYIWLGITDSLIPHFPQSIKTCSRVVPKHIKYHFTNYADEINKYLKFMVTIDESASIIGDIIDEYLLDTDCESICTLLDDLDTFNFDACVDEAFDRELAASLSKDCLFRDNFVYEIAVYDEDLREKLDGMYMTRTAEVAEEQYEVAIKGIRDRSETLRRAFADAGLEVSPWPLKKEEFEEKKMYESANYIYQNKGSVALAIDAHKIIPWFMAHFPEVALKKEDLHSLKASNPRRELLRAAVITGKDVLMTDKDAPNILVEHLDNLIYNEERRTIVNKPLALANAFGPSRHSFVQLVRAASGAKIPPEVMTGVIREYTNKEKKFSQWVSVKKSQNEDPIIIYKNDRNKYTCHLCSYNTYEGYKFVDHMRHKHKLHATPGNTPIPPTICFVTLEKMATAHPDLSPDRVISKAKNETKKRKKQHP